MRVLSILAIFALLTDAQEVLKRTDLDINGNRVADGPAEVVTKGGTTQLSRSINGQIVPLEKTQERVIQEDANGKTVERLIQRYDPTGTSMTPVKEIIQEQNKPGGGSVTTRTVYAGDVNGNLQLQQRSVTQTQKAGDSVSSETTVERPNINGGFEPMSRQVGETIKNGDNYQESSTTYRPDGNGGFVPAVKISKSVTKTNGRTTENAAEYEIGPTGELTLHSQKVQSTVKGPDGSEDVQVQIYGQSVPGVAGSFDPSKLKLTEEQHIERKRTSGDTVVETVEVQRPTLADPSQLGPPKQISETICKGKCGEPDKP